MKFLRTTFLRFMNINKALGIVIDKRLKDLRINRNDFCEKNDIARSFLYKIIEGKSSPTLDFLLKLSKALNMTIGSLVTKAQKLNL